MPPATSEPAPVPQPDFRSWFIGGSAGYLVDTEEFMYCAAVGVDLSSSSAFTAVNFSDEDTVFVGQGFAGLTYALSPAFEIYGGTRWIYLDDATLKGVDLDLEDDVLLELGARIHF